MDTYYYYEKELSQQVKKSKLFSQIVYCLRNVSQQCLLFYYLLSLPRREKK